MKISVIGPVLNEVDFIGQSIMACLDDMHEFVYALDEQSSDGTRDLLAHIKSKYAHEKLTVLEHPNFHPHDTEKYNAAFNRCIDESTGDAVMFLHPDMIITNPKAIATMPADPLAWWANLSSYAGDMKTKITAGRAGRWKNIHAKQFGVRYVGAYGSINEDFYFPQITGKEYRFYGEDFEEYPYEVADSGLQINHYCEVKAYARRLEKMKLCLKTLLPNHDEKAIDEMAAHHPRVTLEQSTTRFGMFAFKEVADPIPDVFQKFGDEFSSFKKEKVLTHA